jgi:uncharacterized membrane protein
MQNVELVETWVQVKTRNIAMRCNQVFSKIFHRSFVMKGHLFLIEFLGGIMAFLIFLKQK